MKGILFLEVGAGEGLVRHVVNPKHNGEIYIYIYIFMLSFVWMGVYILLFSLFYICYAIQCLIQTIYKEDKDPLHSPASSALLNISTVFFLLLTG